MWEPRHRNRWHKPANGWWMCMYWDVIRERRGVWKVHFAIGFRPDNYPSFRTAKEAMRFADSRVE